MLLRSISIFSSSLKMALQQLWKNKLRTFLSLFGITIGIFCIISVLAVVGSLERNIKNEVKSLGSNTIYVDKWEYTNSSDYPWWKYVNRPVPKFSEVAEIKERTAAAKYAAFRITVKDAVEYRGNILSNVNIYGISEDFNGIQPIELSYGRYFTLAEFDRGTSNVVIGDEVAEQLFGGAEIAVGKQLKVRNKNLTVSGVIKKQGKQMIGGWDFDQSVLLTYRLSRNMMNELRSDPVIMVQGQENLSSKALKDELAGTMRSIHQLGPTKEDDFSLNDINDISDSIGAAFVGLNIGGAIIGAISLIVGLFGVANIMFVSVRERTSQIGLKKAIGAKNRVILTEFLLESSFLCIIGGLIGLILVFILTLILNNFLGFPVFVSVSNMIWTLIICIFVGVVAGIIPAWKAATMDPVVAIRSK